ncbi:MAG TPA: anti-sigma regulatory factor [Bacillales bacterium]|nr:anti-sigma regulatory factor [Bacillales bacterium]
MEETQFRIQVNDEEDIVKVRQSGRDLAKLLGFGNVDQVRITTAISELARNILLYAGGGEICLVRVEEIGKSGIYILAADQGPGIENIQEVLSYGFTTSGGLGAGLPGVKRLMDEFTIRSSVGEGTRIETVKWVLQDGREPLGQVFGRQEVHS